MKSPTTPAKLNTAANLLALAIIGAFLTGIVLIVMFANVVNL